MNLVMLAGNSLANRDWVYDVRAHSSELFDDFYVQEYLHWRDGSDWINLERELGVLRSKKLGGSYGVFAKSIGSVLATKAIWHGVLRPKFLLFLGLPLGYISREYPQFREVLADHKCPISVIHNDYDPVGSASDAKEYLDLKLAERGDYNFIVARGDTHDYLDYELILSELARLKDLSS